MERVGTIEVLGTGNISVKADCCILHISIYEEGKDYEKLMIKGAKDVHSLQEGLQSLLIPSEDIITESFRSDVKMKDVKNPNGVKVDSVPDGFYFESVLSITISLDNQLLSKAVTFVSKQDFIKTFHINYSRKDLASFKEKALEEAVYDARKKAKIMAAASGKKIKDVLLIQYPPAEHQEPIEGTRLLLTSRLALNRDIEMEVNPRDLTITEQVRAIFALD